MNKTMRHQLQWHIPSKLFSMWVVLALVFWTLVVYGAYLTNHSTILTRKLEWWSGGLLNSSKELTCDLEFISSWVLVDPDCLANKPPHLEEFFDETINNRRDDVIGFSDEYGIHSAEFTYKGAKPLFAGQLQDFATKLSDPERIERRDNQLSGDRVMLDYAQYDVWRMMYFDYYVTRRDKLEELGPCARINYDVAMIVFDRQMILPWQEFNANRQLAHRIGYCGTSESLSDYVFQWGVCGATSQMFRTALLHPDLNVIERHPHQIWYERYYDETIRWDDAAIIEFRKQLRIQNSWDYSVYFRTINPDWAPSALLVAISPYQDSRYVSIQRWQVADMVWELSATVYDWSGVVLDRYEQVSTYYVRDNSVVN